jgi:hypothetical protein
MKSRIWPSHPEERFALQALRIRMATARPVGLSNISSIPVNNQTRVRIDHPTRDLPQPLNRHMLLP